MAKILKLSIKYFLSVTFVYFILFNLLNFITQREFTAYDIIEGTLIFGVTMTAFIIPFHKFQVKEVGKRFHLENTDLETEQTRIIQSDLEPISVYELLKKRNIYKKVNFNKETQIIEISTGFQGKSWGDRIIVSPNGEDEYQISSKPIFPLTIVDFGQNLENTLKIKGLIQNYR